MRPSAQEWQMWRRLTACLLIYSLFLHGMVFAMVGARLSASAAVGAAFELCRHENAAPALPGTPDGPTADSHCAFCVVGPGFVLEPPAASAVLCRVELSFAPWPLTAWRLAPRTVDATARPRGPPPTA